MKTLALTLVALGISFHPAFAADPVVRPAADSSSPLAGLDALRGEFPMSLRFRSERYDNGKGKHAPPLGQTEAAFATETDGVVEKMLHDIGRYGSEGQQATAQQLPTKVMIEHLLFASVSFGFAKDFGGQWLFSPCHFAYFEGSKAAETPLPTAKTIKLANSKNFREGDAVILLPMRKGKKLWAASEYAAVTAIEGNLLHLRRAVYGTKTLDAQRVPCDAVWVAAMPQKYSEDPKTKTHLVWNWSTLCPRDEKGRQASDAFIEALGRLFAKDGALSHIHGIAWDVPRVSFKEKGSDGRTVDADMDGKGDNGFKDGVNTYAVGAADLHHRVRAVLGEDHVFLSDGFYGDDEDPRLQLPGVFNGIEHDINNDHHFVELSSLINVMGLYDRYVSRPHLNLLVRKDGKMDRGKGGPDPLTQRQNQCMKNAMATLLGMAYSDLSFDEVERGKVFSAADETQCGKENRLHWLGKPTSVLVRPALDAPDVLNGAGVKVTDAFLAGFKSKDSELRCEGDHLLVRARKQDAVSPPDRDPLTFTLTDVPVKKDRGSLIQFEVQSDNLRDFAADVPRIITVTPEGLADWREKKQQLRALLGWTTGKGWTPVSFYFHEGENEGHITLYFAIQGRQNVMIRNFTIRVETEVFARNYEHGVVLCNPSVRTPWTFNLEKLFPGAALRRIAGSGYDKYMAKENTGERIKGSVILKPQSGLFLTKAQP